MIHGTLILVPVVYGVRQSFLERGDLMTESTGNEYWLVISMVSVMLRMVLISWCNSDVSLEILITSGSELFLISLTE